MSETLQEQSSMYCKPQYYMGLSDRLHALIVPIGEETGAKVKNCQFSVFRAGSTESHHRRKDGGYCLPHLSNIEELGIVLKLRLCGALPPRALYVFMV
jgi:hypothetical protein